VTFRAARSDERDRLCEAAARRPWPVAFSRPWTSEDVAELWRQRVAWGFEEALADPRMEILIADEGPVWAVLQHGVDTMPNRLADSRRGNPPDRDCARRIPRWVCPDLAAVAEIRWRN